MKIMFGGGLYGNEALCFQGREILKQLSKNHTIEIDGPHVDGYWSKYYDNFKSGDEDLYIMNGHIPYIPEVVKKHKKIIHLTQFESELPKHWVDCLNYEEILEIWTFSEFTKEMIIKSGVNKPIKVIYLGLNQEFIKNGMNILPLDKSFKFLNVSAPHCVGTKDRKGLDILVPAFKEEFGDNPNVTLILKINTIYADNYYKNKNKTFSIFKYIKNLIPNYNLKNISIITDYISDKKLNDLYNTVDCGVYPSRAEGFGYPQAEMIKIGKPVITTNYSATNEFSDPNLRVNVKDMVQLDSFVFNHPYNGFYFAEPNKEDLKRLMRKVYNLKNYNYSPKILEKFDWNKIGYNIEINIKKLKL